MFRLIIGFGLWIVDIDGLHAFEYFLLTFFLKVFWKRSLLDDKTAVCKWEGYFLWLEIVSLYYTCYYNTNYSIVNLLWLTFSMTLFILYVWLCIILILSHLIFVGRNVCFLPCFAAHYRPLFTRKRYRKV